MAKKISFLILILFTLKCFAIEEIEVGIPIMFQNLGVSQSQRQRLSPTETTYNPRNRSDAEKTQGWDTDANKNQILKHDRYTPPAGPFVQEGWDVFLSGEFLYWQGIQEGLRYATSGVLIQPNTTLSSSGESHKVDYPWKPGFRAALGFYPKHDGWDVIARYTWYFSHSSDQAHNEDGNMLPFTVTLDGITNVTVNGVTHAKSEWNLHYNILDLELGRNFYLSRFLATRLFFGVRGLWITQDWKTDYTSNRIAFGGGNDQAGTIETDQNHHSWGVGIRLGLNGTWTLFKGLSIVSDTSFSSVWNDYDVHRKDQITQLYGTNATTANIKSTPDAIIANITLMLGLQGDWWLHFNRYHLSLMAGYEAQIWIHYGHYIYLNGSCNGDLSFNGLTTRLRFDF